MPNSVIIPPIIIPQPPPVDLSGIQQGIGNIQQQITGIGNTISGIGTALNPPAGQVDWTQFNDAWQHLLDEWNRLFTGGHNPNAASGLGQLDFPKFLIAAGVLAVGIGLIEQGSTEIAYLLAGIILLGLLVVSKNSAGEPAALQEFTRLVQSIQQTLGV